MTIAEAKQDLRKVWYHELRVRARCLELDRIETQVNRVTRWATNDPVQGGRSSHEDLLVKLTELRDQANRSIDRLIEEKRRIQAKIDRIDDPLFAEILIERYIDGLTWEAIAGNVHCSLRNVHRLHGKALIAYAEAGR